MTALHTACFESCVLSQVALFSENSARWLIADQAIMTVGAADAVSTKVALDSRVFQCSSGRSRKFRHNLQVRGSTSPPSEMAYIISNSESRALVVQDVQTLERALPALTEQPGKTNGSSQNGSSAASKAGS